MATPWSVSDHEEVSMPFAQNATEVHVPSIAVSPDQISAMDRILLLSDQQTALAEKIQQPMKYIFTAVTIPLALCNVIVFSQKSMRSASGIYVIGLNLGQVIHVLTQMISDIWAESVDQEYSEFYWCLYNVYVAMYAGLLVANRASYVLLCLSSIERFYAVIRPLHVKNFLLSKRPVLCVIIVYCVSAVWHIYFLARSRPVMVSVPPTGQPVCIFVQTELYFKYPEVNDAFGLAARIVLGYMALMLQLILNVLTVWALRRHNSANKHVTSSTNEDSKRQQERQLTITLLGASVAFLILTLPSVFFNIFATTFRDFFLRGKYENLYFVMSQTTYNLTVLGCGVDFLCYFGLSSKFRKTLRKLMGCKMMKSSQDLERKTHTDVAESSSSG